MRYLNEKQVSEMTGIAVQTLRNWRHFGKGFPYHKIGRCIRYNEQDIISYMEGKKITTADFWKHGESPAEKLLAAVEPTTQGDINE